MVCARWMLRSLVSTRKWREGLQNIARGQFYTLTCIRQPLQGQPPHPQLSPQPQSCTPGMNQILQHLQGIPHTLVLQGVPVQTYEDGKFTTCRSSERCVLMKHLPRPTPSSGSEPEGVNFQSTKQCMPNKNNHANGQILLQKKFKIFHFITRFKMPVSPFLFKCNLRASSTSAHFSEPDQRAT